MSRIAKHKLFALSGTVLLAGLAAAYPAGAVMADGDRGDQVRPDRAEREAVRAERELERGRLDRAITYAEAAVEWDPSNGEHRSILGQAYMGAGRFVAAEQSFSAARELGDTSTRSVIGHALSLIAGDRAADAVQLLDAHRDSLPATDYGLGLALAGETQRGGMILMDIARSAGSTPRDRQNLALAFALSGRWMEAQLIAAQDLGVPRAQQRIQSWAGMLQSGDPRLRIAGVIGNSPVEDPGMPVRLALGGARAAGPVVAMNDPAPVAMFAPPPPAMDGAVAPVAVAAPAYEAPPAPMAPAVSAEPVRVAAAAEPVAVSTATYAEPERPAAPVAAPAVEAAASIERAVAALDVPVEAAPVQAMIEYVSNPVIQPLRSALSRTMAALSTSPQPRPARAAAAAPRRVAAAPAAPRQLAAAPRTGAVATRGWAIQLGAYDSLAVARSSWARQRARNNQLSAVDGISTTARVNGRTFHRLLATGFQTRAQAVSACSALARSGGRCFVRQLDGRDTVQWASRAMPQRLAARSGNGRALRR